NNNIASSSRTLEDQNYYEMQKTSDYNGLLGDNIDTITNSMDNCFLCKSDIMDLRPTSRLTKVIPEITWEKFILDTYPNHKISENWEESIRDFFKPKDTLAEWEKAWRKLFDEKESNEDLVIKDILYNILSPYIEAFKAPFNILKS
ncbi:4753_t:CDS:2, partial [Ambispora leptoticha]